MYSLSLSLSLSLSHSLPLPFIATSSLLFSFPPLYSLSPSHSLPLFLLLFPIYPPFSLFSSFLLIYSFHPLLHPYFFFFSFYLVFFPFSVFLHYLLSLLFVYLLSSNSFYPSSLSPFLCLFRLSFLITFFSCLLSIPPNPPLLSIFPPIFYCSYSLFRSILPPSLLSSFLHLSFSPPLPLSAAIGNWRSDQH